MKKIVTSLAMIVFVGAVVASGTGAFFSDTETSTANVFTAGAIDLKVDSVGHVNGLVCHGGQWIPESQVVWNPQTKVNDLIVGNNIPTAVLAYNTTNPTNVPKAGTVCTSTWVEKDLGAETFFNFADVKPGDEGENTISLHVDNNDAYACIDVSLVANDDVSSVEPELGAGDAQNSGSLFDGELAQNMNFFAWADDGDNIWETGELPLFTNTSGPASDVLDGNSYTIASPALGVLAGGSTRYIGLAWCAGTMTVNMGTHTVSCDGAGMGNIAQTDSMVANIGFRVVQARNNPNFSCGDVPAGVTTRVTANNLETGSATAAKANGKWFFYNDTNDTVMTLNQFSGASGVNNIVAGPGPEGAAQMTLDTNPNPRYNIATYRYNDVKLSDIGSLKYRIYDTDPTNGTPFLNFNIDFNNSDTWQKRLVQVPTSLVANTWTIVDALAGSWTYSGATWPAGLVDNTGTTPGTIPRTWAQILANYPNAETRSTDSWLGVRVGQPGPAGDTGYVSWIEFDGETTDFEN